MRAVRQATYRGAESVTLVLSPAEGSMERLASQLAKHVRTRTLYTNIYSNSAEQFNVGPVRSALAGLWDAAFICRLRRVGGVIHFPNHHLARYGTALQRPYIVTVHDLIRHFDCLGGEPLIHRPNRRDQAVLARDRAGIRAAGAVIAVSRATKRDLVRHLGMPEDRIVVVSPGIDAERFTPATDARLPYPYILFVGSEHPRKNLAALFGALALLKSEPELEPLKLVKVGAAGGGEAPFRQQTMRIIRQLGLEREVIIRGRVAHEELVSLYAGAECLVLPSLYEGFGLPPLEAMACGCPAVVSDRGALPEVVGPAALVAEPTPTGLAGALRRVLRDSELRRRLVDTGRRHVRSFSWHAAASATVEVYGALGAAAEPGQPARPGRRRRPLFR